MKKVGIGCGACLVALTVAGMWFLPKMADRLLYPSAPPSLPRAPDIPMNILLARLEAVLKLKAPRTHESLNPGLPEKEIRVIESKFNALLPGDLEALYTWHDGCGQPTSEFIPGHRFLPAAEALGFPALVAEQSARASISQRAAARVFAGYKSRWIPIFKDPAEDGYFYDPLKTAQSGCFLYHFAEERYYIYFPSLKSVMAAVTECFESGAYYEVADGLKEDYALANRLWLKHGVANQ
jgi:cell wall assembly regulator SMI1